jgi:nucleotide-binding universal stress UspA family protein
MAEHITRILVPMDFSPHAERAFGYATTLAQRFGATLRLVHVVVVRGAPCPVLTMHAGETAAPTAAAA